ncbi:Oxoglutarate iron-dependent oxygenase protein [Rutstroemia sp. NJR-2017a WRK4]|nr:Oxoglutarate iron-dependent oxygenase protein [Rutstroemia sp. NJR-2017a WRK4]
MVLYNEYTVEVLLEFPAPGGMLHDPGLCFTNLSLLAIRRSEWQLTLEKKNFTRLRLHCSRVGSPEDEDVEDLENSECSCVGYLEDEDTEDLENFERIVNTRRDLVTYVGLNLGLRPYTCRTCRLEESDCTEYSNSFFVEKTVSKLLKILSSWNREGKGLTLELNAQSPSDSQHWFRNCYFGDDDRGEIMNTRIGDRSQENSRELHDPEHGWVRGQQLVKPDVPALLRLYEKIKFRKFYAQPKVDAVTTLVIRRHCRRRFVPGTLSSLWYCFPQLEYMIYEPWRLWDSEVQKYYDEKYGEHFGLYLPKGLKTLSVFEDTNEDYIEIVRKAESTYKVGSVRSPTRALGVTFAKKSVALEQLSVAFMIDACCFFGGCDPTWTWSNLKSLALTSVFLTRTVKDSDIFSQLQAAGKAALQMPSLQNMSLWNGRKGEACAFIYQSRDGYRSITWRSTWDLELDPCVVETWERVAAENARGELRVEKELLNSDIIRSHGDAIHHLRLPQRVIDPESLWQIRREHEK